MKVGIISDTHERLDHIARAIRIFQDRHVSVVIHAGDYTSGKAVRAFEGVNLVGVLGNNDVADKQEIIKAFRDIGAKLEEKDVCEMVLDGLKFAIYHGTDGKRKEELIESNRYDLIICGHTHMVENKRTGMYKHTLFLNPGVASGLFFGKWATAMLLDTQTRGVEIIYL